MTAPPFGGGVFIADKSAWVRAQHEVVRAEWTAALMNDQIAACTLSNLEILYSTRTTAEFHKWDDALSSLRLVPISRSVCRAAVSAMRELATRSDGYHRVSLPDYLIAAAAQDAGLGVLHYDHHFDRLAEVMDFDSRWIVAPGSIP